MTSEVKAGSKLNFELSSNWSATPDAVLPDLLYLESISFPDDRGYLFETYNRLELNSFGIVDEFVSEHQSGSKKGVLRGLHYQLNYPQGKLLRVLQGEILDVAVDLRKQSPTFGRWTSSRQTAGDRRQIWIPKGFAHGFYVLSDWAEVHYKATDRYAPEWEYVLAWDDPQLAIQWGIPVGEWPILSEKDAHGQLLSDLPVFDA